MQVGRCFSGSSLAECPAKTTYPKYILLLCGRARPAFRWPVTNKLFTIYLYICSFPVARTPHTPIKWITMCHWLCVSLCSFGMCFSRHIRMSWVISHYVVFVSSLFCFAVWLFDNLTTILSVGRWNVHCLPCLRGPESRHAKHTSKEWWWKTQCWASKRRCSLWKDRVCNDSQDGNVPPVPSLSLESAFEDSLTGAESNFLAAYESGTPQGIYSLNQNPDVTNMCSNSNASGYGGGSLTSHPSYCWYCWYW